jgi:hypothetical protein
MINEECLTIVEPELEEGAGQFFLRTTKCAGENNERQRWEIKLLN